MVQAITAQPAVFTLTAPVPSLHVSFYQQMPLSVLPSTPTMFSTILAADPCLGPSFLGVLPSASSVILSR